MVKTALKLLLVFVEYTESNAALLVKAVNVVDVKRGEWLRRRCPSASPGKQTRAAAAAAAAPATQKLTDLLPR